MWFLLCLPTVAPTARHLSSIVTPRTKPILNNEQSPKYTQRDTQLTHFKNRDADQPPPVLKEDVCLVPGVPLVRIEPAPKNARRIFTGIDIVAQCQDVASVVWDVLTDYEKLPDAVPNLIGNTVVHRFDCGGARLEQVGAAKLAPMVTYRAATTLDVRLYPGGLPGGMEAQHLREGANQGDETEGTALPLRRGIFPRPYCISSLPHRDITMEAVGGTGDFSFYQGVWRLQDLPSCAPEGASAMRLTYSVELRPRLPVPVRLLEDKIASTLSENLIAVREYVCEACGSCFLYSQ